MKRLTVALTALIFALTAIVINPLTGKAVGVDTAVKLVGGKAVVRAVAEKTGMMLSPKQLDNVVDVIEKKTYDGDTEVIEWVNKANLVPSNPSSTPSAKTGFKKYVLDPAMWLTGADLIFEVIDAFQDGYDSGTPVEGYGTGDNRSFIQVEPKYYSTSSGWDSYRLKYTIGQSKVVETTIISVQAGVTFLDLIVTSWSYNSTDGYVINMTYKNSNSSTTYSRQDKFSIAKEVEEWVYPNVISDDDVINTSNVNTNVKNSFDNDTYNTGSTYNMEIEMPDVINYGDTTVWNDIDTELEKEVCPVCVVTPDPPDTDDGDEVIGAVLVKGDPIETPSNFFTLMGDMGAKMHDMYNGVIKFFSDSVSGMEKMLVGSAGLVTFMTGYFDIFPDEFTNVLMVAVMLGFIMHFFRR